MKSTATCTIWFDDGTEIKHVNVTYSRWSHDDKSFVVQRYDPADENRLQTFVHKREHIKQTVREQDYTEEIDLTERPKEQPGLDDPNPTSIQIKEGGLVKFYIVHGGRPDLAWSGSRWVPHIGGYQSSAEKTCGFETRKEAEAYAKGHFPGAALK
jgi:hypothetical protein